MKAENISPPFIVDAESNDAMRQLLMQNSVCVFNGRIAVLPETLLTGFGNADYR